MTPTLAGFLTFIRDRVAIDDTNLPAGDPSIQFAFDLARATVNQALVCVPIGTQPGLTAYDVAVYNLGADILINTAPDSEQSVQDAAKSSTSQNPVLPFFAALRKRWGIGQFQSGVVSGTSDNSTSVTMNAIESSNRFTLGDLQNLKTPYGRAYLQLAQSYGPAIWGLS